MEYTYTVILSSDPEGGFTVLVPALPGCVTEGETVLEALERAREAIECHLESILQHGEAAPQEGRSLSFERDEVPQGLIFRVTAKPKTPAYA